MTAIHETAYPRLKPNPDEQELKQNFLPSTTDLELLYAHTSERSPHSRLAFMLSLKCFQCLGYHISINSIPKLIVKYVSDSLGIQLDKAKLQSFLPYRNKKSTRTK